jgi:hypothetical protein
VTIENEESEDRVATGMKSTPRRREKQTTKNLGCSCDDAPPPAAGGPLPQCFSGENDDRAEYRNELWKDDMGLLNRELARYWSVHNTNGSLYKEHLPSVGSDEEDEEEQQELLDGEEEEEEETNLNKNQGSSSA